MVGILTEENSWEKKDKLVSNSTVNNNDLKIPEHVTSDFGDIVIKNSDNVTVGDIAYFNGPVIVKQFVVPENTTTPTETSDNRKEISKGWLGVFWIVLLITAFLANVVTLLVLSKQQNGVVNPLTFSKDVNQSDYNYNTTENGLKIITRFVWNAQPANKPLSFFTSPPNIVAIGHTGEEGCSTTSECILTVRILQSYYIDFLGFPDMKYNFLIGGNGIAYVGLGWNVSGYGSHGYKNGQINIAFIGNFDEFEPKENQIKAALLLIEDGVQQGKIASDYELFAECQLIKTSSPGKYLYLNIKTWKYFNDSIICEF